MRLHAISNYVDLRYTFLKKVEGEVFWAYADSKRIPTIGIGLNLRTHGELVLSALGFDLGGTKLTGAALIAERAYADRIMKIINGQRFAVTTNPFGVSDNAVMQALNAVLNDRAQNSLLLNYDSANFTSFEAYSSYRISLDDTALNGFRLPSATVSAELLRQTLDDGYSVPDANGGTKTFNGGYEKLLDEWLDAVGISAVQPDLKDHNSTERLVLLSLTFNSRVHKFDQANTSRSDVGLPTLLGAKLAAALLYDDRAEVWYEIRYNSGNDPARRFLEADTFGLYDIAQANNDIDAKGAFRTYTRHRATMDAYENNPNNQKGITTAISRGDELGIVVQRLDGHLQPARVYLAATYGEGISITSEILVGEHQTTAYYKETEADALAGAGDNDLLFGESGVDRLEGLAGRDVIYGGSGNDVLMGGQENDILIGGTGRDIYYYKSGDGNDTIRDEDGRGWIVFEEQDGNAYGAVGGFKEFGQSEWLSPDGYFRYSRSGSRLIIHIAGEPGTITVEDDARAGCLSAVGQIACPCNHISSIR